MSEKWMAVRCDGEWYIGRYEADPTLFSETYKVVFLEVPKGNERGELTSVGIFIDVHPVLAFGGTVPMRVVPSAAIPFDDLDVQDRVSIMRKVEDCKKKQQQIRAERSGIALAPAGSIPRH